MLKLIKYEFRKNRTLLLTILGLVAALEIFFLVSAHIASGYSIKDAMTDSADQAYIRLAVSAALLGVASFGTAMAVFIMGVAGYSRELNQKTSYLVFMTPNSTLAMVGSKLLFTMLTGVGFAALLMLLAFLDFPIFAGAIASEWRGYYNLLDYFMASNDLSLTGALLTIAFYVCVVFLSIISTVSVAYFAITLSATFMRGKKGHALVSVALFLALSWGISQLVGLMMPKDVYLMVSNAKDMTRLLAPQALLNLVVLALSIVSCAWMLKKRVDL